MLFNSPLMPIKETSNCRYRILHKCKRLVYYFSCASSTSYFLLDFDLDFDLGTAAGLGLGFEAALVFLAFAGG